MGGAEQAVVRVLVSEAGIRQWKMEKGRWKRRGAEKKEVNHKKHRRRKKEEITVWRRLNRGIREKEFYRRGRDVMRVIASPACTLPGSGARCGDMLSIHAIAFYGYPVENMAEARRFYEGVLGLKVKLDHEGKWVEYDIGGGTLAITTLATERVPGAAGGFIALNVDDLDASLTELKAKGITLVVEPFETPFSRLAVIADPDGNEITLRQGKPGHQ